LTFSTLANRGVAHYWRTYLASALGIATAVAVLSGAYTVGRSVRESLRDLALSRIGATNYALTSQNFFREALAPACPLVALQGAVVHDASGRRASDVAVYGIDGRFFDWHGTGVSAPGRNEFLLSPALAQELSANKADALLVRMPRASAVPTESLHGRKEDPGRTIRGSMRDVVPRERLGEFSLRSQQGPVRAIFVNLGRLQRELEIDGRANVSLLSGIPDLASTYKLEDLGVRLNGRMLEHESMILSEELVETTLKIDPQAQPVLAYLANSMQSGGHETPYSLIAAINRSELRSESDILLTDWAARDLNAKQGHEVTLEYYLWDPSGRLLTQRARFRVAGIVPVDPTDRELAPEYPGISDADSLADWDPPFPIDLSKVRPIDEQYWDKYRATPKAYISLDAGQKLWRTRYGAVTSIRTSPHFSPEKLRDAIDPLTAGLAINNVRAEALAASRGATDFGEYFIYFSFFLVVSALLLAGLFFRFGVEQRMDQVSTLRAIGFSLSDIRRLLLREALVVAVFGSLLGVAGAMLYGWLILLGLRTWWVDAVGTRDLSLHVSPDSVVLGMVGGLLMAPIAVAGTLRSLRQRRPREAAANRRSRALTYAAISAVLGIGLAFAGGAGGFFGAGALLLIAALLFVRHKLGKGGSGIDNVHRLGLRYASYRPGRSVLCIALIAAATFIIVAVDSFRRTGSGGEPGYRYFAESAIPIYHDPNTESGLEALNLSDAPRSRWLLFRLRPGDDASCLNLYAPQNPRVLGAPVQWLRPDWKLAEVEEDGTIPAAVDANSLTYVLHKKIGEIVQVGDARLRIVTALHDSVFQSEIIISEPNFRRAFPEEQGYRVFLIDAPPGADGELETALSDYGLDMTSTAERLAAFHRVENTYLSTFQALGALGLLLGTIGLGAVLLRNVLERRRELALLRAVGYKSSDLTSMTLAETLLLLGCGLLIGMLAALIAVAPAVWQRGGSLPVASMLALVAAVAVTGFVTSWLAVRAALRAPLLSSLRTE
jgi:ABC-type lipoprotein release transport system permease subunit